MSGAVVSGERPAPRHLPVATYRLQVHGGFPLADARARVPYLHRLGVTDLYTSPLLASIPGSPHGYDVVDPTRIDPEVGGEEELAALADALHRRGMGLVLDLVPNHMAASHHNPWWRHLLAHGPDSPYAPFFDVRWHRERDGRLLLPILGEPYGDELVAGTLRLEWDEGGGDGEGEVVLRYWEREFPVRWPVEQGAEPGPPPAAELEAVNADPQALDRVISAQPYRPAVWRLAAESINYRRFFDVADLAGVRQEDEAVFLATHRLPLRLVREGTVDGLRIDHVDGLRDPRGYLERLQRGVGVRAEGVRAEGGDAPVWVVVEKILAADEDLPADWPVAGTTGYDFQNSLTGLYVDPGGLRDLDRLYARYTGELTGFEEVRSAHKHQALAELFPGELGELAEMLEELAAADLTARDLPPSELARALTGVTAALPVYRTYVRAAAAPDAPGAAAGGPSAQDRAFLERALAEARERADAGPLTPRAFDFLERVLTLDVPPELAEETPRWQDFVARWQQLTGPAMAKGLEDTALYVYNRLLSLNAVGGEPEGIDPPGDAAAFHRRNRERLERWPHAMTCTFTHDAKRSEDVRARLNVLSELIEEWRQRVESWTELNRLTKRSVAGRLVPDANEEIFLYQTLVGAWPLEEGREAGGEPDFPERLETYLVKAAREAKVHTNWHEPDAAYEEALLAFPRALLDPTGANPFLDELLGFVDLVAFYGAWNSLSQVVLKVACPGVPDFYQGSDLWNLSLVDPDNRRPVDWGRRERALDELERRQGEDREGLLAELVEGWRDGRVKLWFTWKALTLRRARRELFLRGAYVPLEVEGEHGESVVALARRWEGGEGGGVQWVVAVAPRWLSRVVGAGELPVGRVWGETAVVLPGQADGDGDGERGRVPGRWMNVLDGAELEVVGGRLRVAEVFGRVPGGLLVGEGSSTSCVQPGSPPSSESASRRAGSSKIR